MSVACSPTGTQSLNFLLQFQDNYAVPWQEWTWSFPKQSVFADEIECSQVLLDSAN